ncbi:unnamed protein product, partial [Linum tenue]
GRRRYYLLFSYPLPPCPLAPGPPTQTPTLHSSLLLHLLHPKADAKRKSGDVESKRAEPQSQAAALGSRRRRPIYSGGASMSDDEQQQAPGGRGRDRGRRGRRGGGGDGGGGERYRNPRLIDPCSMRPPPATIDTAPMDPELLWGHGHHRIDAVWTN